MNIDVPISTIMISEVTSVSPDQKLIDIKHIYEKPNFHSHIPVTENDNVVGIISLINFMHAIKGASLDDSEEVYHNRTVRDIMTRNPVSVSPQASIREIATILAKGDFHSLLITSENKLKGIVTTTDILRKLIKD